jgi:hypothetical protein
LRGRDQEDSAGAKSSQDLVSTSGWAQWYILVISATWGSTVRTFAVQANPGHKARWYLKNNQCKKGWWGASRGKDCLVRTRPCVQLQYHQEKKGGRERGKEGKKEKKRKKKLFVFKDSRIFFQLM